MFYFIMSLLLSSFPQVTATDIDSGSNALLTYYFANGTDQTTSDLFVLDSKTGTISATTSLLGEGEFGWNEQILK